MKGIAKAAQGDRVSQEGLIAFFQNTTRSTLVEINSETDFVGKNEKFHSFVAMVANVVNSTMPSNVPIDIPELLNQKDSNGVQTVAESLGDIVTQIRENIVIRRAMNIEMPLDSTLLSCYLHGKVGTDNTPPNMFLGKSAAVVMMKYNSSTPLSDSNRQHLLESGKRLAMHVVCLFNPNIYIYS